MTRRIISITLAVTLLVCSFITPSLAMDKYQDIIFLASDEMLSDDYISVSADNISNDSFKVSSSDTIAITAENGATIRRVYLVKSGSGQPGAGKFTGSVVFGICIALLADISESGSADYTGMQSALVTTNGQVIPSNDGYTIQDIDSESIELNTTGNEIPISSIEVLYSLPMTEEEIVAAIDLSGEEYLAAKDAYESASQNFSDKQKAFEPIEKEYNEKKAAYDKAKEDWAPIEAQINSADTAYQNALKDFNSAKIQYVSDRDTYLPVYVQAKADLAALNNAAGLSEGDGLPEFVAEDTSIAPAAPSATAAASPVFRANEKQSFENPMLSTDFINLTAHKGQVANYKYYIINSSHALTLTGKQGAIIDSVQMHIMERDETKQGKSGGDKFGFVFIEEEPSLAVSNGEISKKDDVYSVSKVDSDSLTITMTNNASIQILKIDVSYARPLNKDELIEKVNKLAAPFKSSKEVVLDKLATLNAAEAEYNSLLSEYAEEKAAWDKVEAEWQTIESNYNTEKKAFDNAKSAFEEAEKKYNEALEIYETIYNEAKEELGESDLPAYLLGEGSDATATITSEGNLWIIIAVAAFAIGAAGIAIKKKKRQVSN